MVKMPISGAKSIEYVEEVTYGTTPTDPVMGWVGLVNPFSPHIAKEYEEARYSGAHDAVDMLQKMRNMQVSGELTASMTYKPQDWTFLQYITGNATGLSDTVDSISVVQYTDGQWIVYKGGMLTKWELTLPKESIATVDVDMTFGGIADPTVTDFIGIGSHASENTTAPFKWEDTTNIKLNGASIMHCLGELKLGITNEVKLPKDIGSSMWTRAEGAVVTKRELSVSLELTWADLSFFNLVKAGTKQTLSFTLGDKRLTVTGLIFPEVGYEITPDNFIGETVTAITNLPDLTIADIILRGAGNFAGPSGVIITHNGNLLDYAAFLVATADSDASVGERYIGSSGLNSFIVYNSGSGLSAFRWVIPDNPYDKGNSAFAGPGGQTVTHTKGDTNYVPCIIPSANGSGAIGEWWITDIANTSFVVRNSGMGVTAFKWAIPRFYTNGKGASSFAGNNGVLISHNLDLVNYTPLIIPTANPEGHLGAVYVTDIASNSFRVRNTGTATTSFMWVIHTLS